MSGSKLFANVAYSKTYHKRPLKTKTKNCFLRTISALCMSKVLQNATREHSVIFSNSISYHLS